MALSFTYKLSIPQPETHLVEIRISGERPENVNQLRFFLPTWSPGSYLIREYARHILQIKAQAKDGRPLSLERVGKSEFLLDWQAEDFAYQGQDFELIYQVYCHELTVRTSHVNKQHAFLHGPSLFLGVLDHEIRAPKLEVQMPPAWAKITTGLKDISPSRERFVFEARDYDDLIDSPLELGCQETDGFLVEDVPHELAFWGWPLPNKAQVKADMKKIVETVLKTTKDIPYEKYSFITHFAPQLFGGLEHSNSTALQYCPIKFAERKGYLNWLSLVAHEYFHTWNVKRIRPRELGPFPYLEEAMTRMHWLTEGLTSFMDELFVVRSGLCRLDEYLEMQRQNLNRYLATPGRKFHSVEESSYLAWIKLYRPDENSANSSVSYYLKGGLVFFILNQRLVDAGHSIDQFIQKLWAIYQERPESGLTRDEVFAVLRELLGEADVEEFESMISSTEELSLEKTFKRMGVEWEFDEQPDKVWLGLRLGGASDRLMVEVVEMDGPAYKSGLNAGDEIVAIEGWRVLKPHWSDWEAALRPDQAYRVLVARQGRLQELAVTPSRAPKTTIKQLVIKDSSKLAHYLGVPE